MHAYSQAISGYIRRSMYRYLVTNHELTLEIFILADRTPGNSLTHQTFLRAVQCRLRSVQGGETAEMKCLTRRKHIYVCHDRLSTARAYTIKQQPSHPKPIQTLICSVAMAQPNSTSSLEALATEILDLSKNYEPPSGGFGAKSALVLKAEELIKATQTPVDHALNLITTMTDASAIRTSLSFKVFDAMPIDKPISLQDLEKSTGVQAALLDRLLRILAGSGFVQHDEQTKTYAHTALSAGYRSDAMAGMMFGYIFDEVAVMTKLHLYFKARGAHEPDGEAATTHNPATWVAGQEGKTVFEVLEQDPEKLEGFVRLMRMGEKFRPWTGFYDYGALAQGVQDDRPVFVDVGGADGTGIAKILEAHPNIKPEQCTVQDREKVIVAAKANDHLPSGVQFSSHDFFTPQPVKNAKAYQLRAICHDWSDTMVTKILAQIVPAMAPDSKILIGDNVLPESGVVGMAAFMDLAMMCIGGKERTRANFEAVCDAAGLKVDNVYSAPGAIGFAIVEASLK